MILFTSVHKTFEHQYNKCVACSINFRSNPKLQADIERKIKEDESRASEAAHAASLKAKESVVPILGRRLIYSHHIINEQKRADVIHWAAELRLGGFSKYGWPGVVVVEGAECDCKEYLKRLKQHRWQYLTVKGEETVSGEAGGRVDQLRRLPMGFEELGPDGLGEIAARCKESGLEAFYLASMGKNIDHIQVAEGRGEDASEGGKTVKAAKMPRGKKHDKMQREGKPHITKSGLEELVPHPVPSCIKTSPEGEVKIVIRAKPGAKMSSVTDISPEAVGVSLQAPAREGEANTELVRYISSILGLKKTHVLFESGHKSRDKVLRIMSGMPAQEVAGKISAAAGKY